MRPFRIIVPASSGNVGPGFDSMGLAVNLFLELEVSESAEWEFIQPSLDLNLESYEEHFIYSIAKKIADKHQKTLPACKVVEKSAIPLARGLGSSASAILAGIEIANQACELKLSKEEKLQYGTEIEGHPDNIAPALFGGLVISTLLEDEIEHIQLQDLDFDIVVYIPDVELKTEAARAALPESYPRNLAAAASGVSNITVAALVKGDYQLAGKMMEKDLFHEPYRASLIPNYDMIRSEAKKLGAYGTIISGAGPTMMSFVPNGEGQAVALKMKDVLPDYQMKALQVDTTGLKVESL
ncbi:homoserine kinase [Oceanobacillus piezotolerans]|uniref:Homoserine kinase n=1 Tax=Oceanobacillus piezotolerans TaxID=2448030 RepID=A0A498DJ88_9BACI|nr:homoserine kinase [Oceanobacillus piezotolerans]RLL42006.1 homoserine kinase [Oceanobacillus piezotolerans]